MTNTLFFAAVMLVDYLCAVGVMALLLKLCNRRLALWKLLLLNAIALLARFSVQLLFMHCGVPKLASLGLPAGYLAATAAGIFLLRKWTEERKANRLLGMSLGSFLSGDVLFLLFFMLSI